MVRSPTAIYQQYLLNVAPQVASSLDIEDGGNRNRSLHALLGVYAGELQQRVGISVTWSQRSRVRNIRPLTFLNISTVSGAAPREAAAPRAVLTLPIPRRREEERGREEGEERGVNSKFYFLGNCVVQYDFRFRFLLVFSPTVCITLRFHSLICALSNLLRHVQV
jgi:hypothetical protein